MGTGDPCVTGTRRGWALHPPHLLPPRLVACPWGLLWARVCPPMLVPVTGNGNSRCPITAAHWTQIWGHQGCRGQSQLHCAQQLLPHNGTRGAPAGCARTTHSHHTLPPHTHTGLVPCPLKGHATGHAGCHRVAGVFSACWLNLGIGGGGFASSLSGSLCSKFGRPSSSDVCPCLQPRWPVTFPHQALSSSVNLPLPYCLSPFWLL